MSSLPPLLSSMLSSVIRGPALLPIIQADTPHEAVFIAKALADGGVGSVEVVLRTRQALAAITAIRTALPSLLVGAGTILSAADANACKDAGAQFLVSPASTPQLLEAMIATGLPLAPGVATPSEIAMAYEYGLREVKFFPAHLSGGIEMLKALSGVFQQVKFCPTGGIAQHNLADFLALPNVFVAGGSWLTPASMVQSQQWSQITALAAAATAIARQIKTAA
ncbi:MAG: bifunctional 4-hydroxy-2-oxoglutarate aldolase/2-dehydro-3-deoxy-phosphogluconate aldolase [Gammaproteobacteria bacterium]|nr:bifunctional 4-hydroxy-2-oxoglutarate aldolase/2-dehydro-3-deoxy-phosphogluconate aldolase [Gammaproteobacteria bacterium]MBU1556465.1 bifunctional 4-hydroxy-2-oxoglutarate aldolase/2-dehydro-3-deoxy-phosphogluconate aldolase [Gammaproteobacteria bacterium]MBU2070411.1 bifunctional 4-hydroxy-2-oxoglutarate aldolase/2-dehydro-3-deoxy-phosphogluconate aldolase [Gammaproteobacteria bacterium]MBU2184727.1 bifunctional 4-hydroxy-2-oxoglutarate aldolase/2-dehydro-3-deoxy-phosphogluconate aldolase [